jgi:oxygen-independent coproporphyrinogen-3 oxidase
MPETTPAPVTSLYVHVPFCAQKCEYCAFFSEASSGELINRYVNTLQRELEIVAGDLHPRTIFFGGGTPSLLNLRQWESLLGTMERLGLSGAEEFTVECNPATVSLEKAKLLRSLGVNRISMGVQSLDESLLDRLGRVHSREMVFKSFDTLRQAGFDNVNIDLMFAIPGQTMDIWRATLDEALALGSEHLSSYEVIYEEDTPLYAQLKAGEFDVNEDLACDMFEELVQRSSAAGFRQYEIANFARDARVESLEKPSNTQHPTSNIHRTPLCQPLVVGSSMLDVGCSQGFRSAGVRGFESETTTPCFHNPLLPALACKHNVNYWRGGDFYGLGPSATGYVRGVRTKNWANTQLYCEQLEKGKRAIESREEFPPLKRAGETAAFGLRMNAGWPFAEFQRVTGLDLREAWSADMDSLVQKGWALRSMDRFQLTPQGLRFADAAAEQFLR